MRYITCSATILDMRTAAVLVAAILALPVAAQTAKPSPPPPAKPATAPTVTAEQRAAYWKATTQQAGSQKQLEAANAAVTQAVQEMVAACGKDANLTQAQNGDPVCVLKSAEKK